MKLSVVIVNYNVKFYLEQCLRSLYLSAEGIEMEVFVVDNNSSDGSIAYLRVRFPQVHYIENKDNKGFSKANNQAIREARGEYVLLLNPDTLLTGRTLKDCLALLDNDPHAGATGVAMYDAQGRFALESRRALPVPWTSFCKMTGLTRLFPRTRLFGRYYMQFLDPKQTSQIEVISGAFMMIRHEALNRVGLLDEDFFMYGEDVDLSYRLLQGGWQNWYVPTPILHYKGESTQKSSFKYVYNFYNAMLIFINKHYRNRYHFFVYFIHLAVHLRAGIDMLNRAIRHVKAWILHEDLKSVDLNMEDFHVYEYGKETYDDILEHRIRKYRSGHKKLIGIHYPEQGITVLPYGILKDNDPGHGAKADN